MVSISGGDKLSARLQELSKRVTKAATLQVGFLENASYPDGTSVALVAAINEFGSAKAPPRPFFRSMIAEKSGTWGDTVADLLKENEYDANRTLNLMGEGIKGQLQGAITTFVGAPLAEATIKAKGSDKQLVDSGVMLASVDYTVE